MPSYITGGRFQSNGISLLGKDASIFILNSGTIQLGYRVGLADYVLLEANSAAIRIGTRTTINSFSRIVAHEEVTIGSNCAIAQFVTIVDHDHVFGEQHDSGLSGFVRAKVEIGNNVWIGDKATILKGVCIGDNSIVGAGAVVNKDVPADSIAVGIPCRILPRREQDGREI